VQSRAKVDHKISSPNNAEIADTALQAAIDALLPPRARNAPANPNFKPISDTEMNAEIYKLLPRRFIPRSELINLPFPEGDDTEGSEDNFFPGVEQFPFDKDGGILSLAPHGSAPPTPHWCHIPGGYAITNHPCKKRDYFHLLVHGIGSFHGIPERERSFRRNGLWLILTQAWGDPEEVEAKWLTLDGAPIVFISLDVAKAMGWRCHPGVVLRHGLEWRRCDGTTEGDLSYELVRRRMELGWPVERLLDPPQRTSKPAA